MRNFFLLIPLLGIVFCVSCKQGNRKEKKEDIFAQKADSVLSLMTLDEKIGQLNQYTGNWQATGPLVYDTTKYTQIRQGMVGAMLNIKGAEKTKALQKLAMQSRLKIPLLFGLDVVHGFRTIFPIPLAEAASFDLKAIKRSARIAAEEASASGVNWTFAPMVDISRDARWGRVMEGAGEDPWYGAKVAVARVHGFQGSNLSDNNTILACAKHFAAYGAPIAGKDYNTVDMSNVSLYNIYLPPYKAAAEAGVGTFMNAFNELNGVPCTGNKFLLRNILKGKWNFKGFVVSDWGSIGEMVTHGYVANRKEAAKAAISAGTDMDMESRCYIDFLKKLVQDHQVDEKLIDAAVRRILIKKFQLGLFEDPYRYCDESREKKILMNPRFKAAARDMARKSIVLLKNDSRILPLAQNIKSIALVGPLMKSKTDMSGFWANEQWTDSVVTVWAGMKNALPNTKLSYIEGYDLKTGKLDNIRKTLMDAGKADAIVVAVGERWDDSGEAKSSGLISVKKEQQKLVSELVNTGKPVIVLIMGGRPLIFNEIRENASSILYTWWLGTEAGNAITDVLLGKYNPSAKLPMTFPKYVGQVPIYYNHKNTGRPGNSKVGYSSRYKDIDFEPAYPFGYGLSYATFKYGDLKIDQDEINRGDSLEVSIKVTNTSNIEGKEVVQLYIRDKVAQITRPIEELKGFKMISLKQGESKLVKFKLTENDLGYWDNMGNYILEPGEFEVMVGPNSKDLQRTKFVLK